MREDGLGSTYLFTRKQRTALEKIRVLPESGGSGVAAVFKGPSNVGTGHGDREQCSVPTKGLGLSSTTVNHSRLCKES